jgi:hypothetical protein
MERSAVSRRLILRSRTTRLLTAGAFRWSSLRCPRANSKPDRADCGGRNDGGGDHYSRYFDHYQQSRLREHGCPNPEAEIQENQDDGYPCDHGPEYRSSRYPPDDSVASANGLRILARPREIALARGLVRVFAHPTLRDSTFILDTANGISGCHRAGKKG